jgi:hypothetical protein
MNAMTPAQLTDCVVEAFGRTPDPPDTRTAHCAHHRLARVRGPDAADAAGVAGRRAVPDRDRTEMQCTAAGIHPALRRTRNVIARRPDKRCGRCHGVDRARPLLRTWRAIASNGSSHRPPRRRQPDTRPRPGDQMPQASRSTARPWTSGRAAATGSTTPRTPCSHPSTCGACSSQGPMGGSDSGPRGRSVTRFPPMVPSATFCERPGVTSGGPPTFTPSSQHQVTAASLPISSIVIIPTLTPMPFSASWTLSSGPSSLPDPAIPQTSATW